VNKSSQKKILREKLRTKDRLIISIDVGKKSDVVSLCKKVNNKVTTLKIGLQLIYSLGLEVVSMVKSFGYKILLDAKLHDIPNTILGTCAAISKLNVDMITIHTLGGKDMLVKAKNYLASLQTKDKKFSPLLFGVTILTSLDDSDLKELGFDGGYLSSVINLASIARKSNLDGIICSPNEVRIMREKFGDDFYIATPGIRLAEEASEDQKRISTPKKAITDGADFIIVGRSITRKKNVGETVDIFLEKIEEALKSCRSSDLN